MRFIVLMLVLLPLTGCAPQQMQAFARGMQNYNGQSTPGQIDWGSAMRGFGSAHTGGSARVSNTPTATPVPSYTIDTQPMKQRTTYRQIGDVVYSSDGTNYRIIDNILYGSDGTHCQAVGDTVYCN